MTLGELKTYVTTLINRTDLTDALVTQFIQQAQDRLERLLRPSFLQRYVEFTLDGTSGDFKVPVDYLELISLHTDSGELRRVPLAEWLRHDAAQGVPAVFLQTGHDLRMRPWPSSTTTCYITYFGTEPELTSATAENYWTTAAVDAFSYGACSLAADYFEDERLQRFEQKFQDALNEIRDQQLAEDFSGPLSISPAYRFDQD